MHPPLLYGQILFNPLSGHERAIPVRSIVVLAGAVWRNAQHERLSARPRGRQCLVEQVPAILGPLWLDEFPVHAEVGDAGGGMVLVRQAPLEFLVLDGKSFRPFQAFIQAVAVEALERHEANAGIDEHVIHWFRTDGDDVSAEPRSQQRSQKQPSGKGPWHDRTKEGFH